jgi:hypothetical protein
MKTPVKGQWCLHPKCFDLETYIATNTKFSNRKWICPTCPLDKPIMLFRDEFMMKLIEATSDDETQCTINEKLEIKFNPGKTYVIVGEDFYDASFIGGQPG